VATADRNDLFELVHRFCTIDQIKAVLRTGEGNAEVRLSAPSKQELINRNLANAIASNAIPIERIYDLVRDAEENGNQHIFYYLISKKLLPNVSFDAVGTKLWRAAWPLKMKFPSFRAPQDKYVFADFRLWNPTKKPSDWVLKIYGQFQIERPTGVVQQESERKILREFEIEDKRIVLVIRFNAPNLLEIRVPTDTSKKRVAGYVSTAWDMLSPAIAEVHVLPWDLTAARGRMLKSGKTNTSMYRARDTRLRNEHTTYTIEANAITGTLFDSEDDTETLKRTLERRGECTHVSILWLEQKDGRPSRDVRTIIGAAQVNEVIIPGQCSPTDVEYVTEQLRFFSK
jgi:hypothetical protein